MDELLNPKVSLRLPSDTLSRGGRCGALFIALIAVKLYWARCQIDTPLCLALSHPGVVMCRTILTGRHRNRSCAIPVSLGRSLKCIRQCQKRISSLSRRRRVSPCGGHGPGHLTSNTSDITVFHSKKSSSVCTNLALATTLALHVRPSFPSFPPGSNLSVHSTMDFGESGLLRKQGIYLRPRSLFVHEWPHRTQRCVRSENKGR